MGGFAGEEQIKSGRYQKVEEKKKNLNVNLGIQSTKRDRLFIMSGIKYYVGRTVE